MFLFSKAKYIISIILVIIITGCPSNFTIAAPATVPAREMPAVMYIDNSLSHEKMQLVAKAITVWEIASGDTIDIIPIWDQQRPGLLYKTLRRVEGDGIFFWYISKNDPNHLPGYAEALEAYAGFFIPGIRSGMSKKLILGQKDKPNKKPKNIIYVKDAGNIIIFSEYEGNKKFYNVVLHELGHMLRLKHVDNKRAIMYEKLNGQNCITQFDAKQLCKIYKCKPNPECYIF